MHKVFSAFFPGIRGWAHTSEWLRYNIRCSPSCNLLRLAATRFFVVDGAAQAQVTGTWINNGSTWTQSNLWAGGLVADTLGTNNNLQNIPIDGSNTTANPWQLGGSLWAIFGEVNLCQP